MINNDVHCQIYFLISHRLSFGLIDRKTN